MIPKQNFLDFLNPMIKAAWALSSQVSLSSKIIWANPNAPEPAAPAFVVRVTVSQTPDHPEYTDVDVNGLQNVVDQVEATMTITGVGAGTLAALQDVAGMLKTQTAIRTAAAQNIAMIDRPRITDITGMLNQVQMEERGQLTVSVRFVNAISDNVGIIEEVTATGTYSGSNLAPDLGQDIDAPVGNTTP